MIKQYKITTSEGAARDIKLLLKQGQLAAGQQTNLLEKELGDATQAKHVLAVNSGTAALHLALLAANIQPGDEVIVPNFTFIATAHAVLMCGATPIFADISLTDYNLDPQDVADRITAKTKAIIAVNLYGQPADYEKLTTISKSFQLTLIEDAAQSIGATFQEKPSGSLADIGCLSFYATKNVQGGEGGAITTNHTIKAAVIEQLRNHGRDQHDGYSHVRLGYNYRLSNLHACIARYSLKEIASNTEKRQAIANRYLMELDEDSWILPHTGKGRSHVYHQFTLRAASTKVSREMIIRKLTAHDIEAGIYYPHALTDYPHLREYENPTHPTPNSMLAAQTVFSIPIHPMLTHSEVSQIIKALNQ